MSDATEGTDALYGGGTALTNGLSGRYENAIGQNLGVYKKNQDFFQFGAERGDNYITKAAGSDYGMSFPFNLKETYGIVFRLSNNSQYIKLTVNDDLTILTEHRAVATGQLTLNED